MHIPGLTEKILEYLAPKPNENFIDCTAGGGGHTFPIAELIAPKGKILAIDWDPEAITDSIEVVFPPGTAVTAVDRMRPRGLTYEIDGTPDEQYDPMTGVEPGVRVIGRRVAG